MSVASISLPGEPSAARLAMLSMRNAMYRFGKSIEEDTECQKSALGSCYGCLVAATSSTIQVL
jgi:hypothetical protein